MAQWFKKSTTQLTELIVPDFWLFCEPFTGCRFVLLWLRSQFTCKSLGSCILLVLVLLPGVTVTELDRDERLLRAEEGRDDDRLSGTQSKRKIERGNVSKNTHLRIHTYIYVYIYTPLDLINRVRTKAQPTEWQMMKSPLLSEQKTKREKTEEAHRIAGTAIRLLNQDACRPLIKTATLHRGFRQSATHKFNSLFN